MNKQIIKLAIPNIISNITIPLLGMADLAIMGHLDSELYLGAISLGGMIFNFIYLIFNFLRMGTGGLTAQAYGKGSNNLVRNLFFRSLFIALLSGIFLILLQVPIEKVGFHLIEGSYQVENLASEYFYIRIYAAPATIGLFAVTGWLIGMQDAKTPMYIAIIINVLNLLLNLLFVYGFGMKSNGVALATVISQYTGLFLSLLIIGNKHKKNFIQINIKEVFDRIGLYQFFKVNSDIFIRTVILISVFSFFTAESAKSGDKILAVNTLLLQYLMMFSFIMDGFAQAAEALSGKYFGRATRCLLKKMVKYVFIWGFAMSLLFSTLYFFFGQYALLIFTDNQVIIEDSRAFLIWVSLAPLLSFASYLWDGIYIGVTASRAMRNTMLASSVLVFFPIYFFTKDEIGNHAPWVAILGFLLARGVFQTLVAKKAVFGKMASSEALPDC
ncbi:MAG: MATE family efflux transporter [Bacteroidales bacterium]|nr:MATE family efflux transporter [Bacteroidales bacterium]